MARTEVALHELYWGNVTTATVCHITATAEKLRTPTSPATSAT